MLKLSLNPVEIACLQIVLRQASDTTYTDKVTRRAMREFLERVVYAIKAQTPEYDLKLEYGDF